jgi:hypothetical protein
MRDSPKPRKLTAENFMNCLDQTGAGAVILMYSLVRALYVVLV